MGDKLVKEIITTTTERFSDSGNIKEKITESREKIYSTNFSDKEIAEAKPVEKEEEPEAPKEKAKEQLIQEAAKAIEKPKTQEQPAPYVPWSPNTPPQSLPQYNVASRATAAIPTTKFPWEQ